MACAPSARRQRRACPSDEGPSTGLIPQDRKSTRLNSSHSQISYAVFCLKKKKDAPPCLRLISIKQSTISTDNGRPLNLHPSLSSCRCLHIGRRTRPRYRRPHPLIPHSR